MKCPPTNKKGSLLKLPSIGCQANDVIIKPALVLPGFGISKNTLLSTTASKLGAPSQQTPSGDVKEELVNRHSRGNWLQKE